MEEYSFKELEPEITAKLKEIDKTGFFGKNKKLGIMDGFVYLPIQTHIGREFNIGGRTLPVVIVIDQDNGQIWQFSLKQLVPRIDFK